VFLIVAAPFSGTTYTAILLRKLGLNVGHERPGGNGTVCWHLAAVGPPYIMGESRREHRPDRTHYKTILHQVRHPLKMITTFQHNVGQPNMWPYICAHVGMDQMAETPLRRTMKFWLVWNMLSEKCAGGKTYQIEDLPNRFEWFCKEIGVPANRDTLHRLSTRENSHQAKFGMGRYLRWDELFAEDVKVAAQIKQMAQRYGYEE
jgi:hypothetical protein